MLLAYLAFVHIVTKGNEARCAELKRMVVGPLVAVGGATAAVHVAAQGTLLQCQPSPVKAGKPEGP